MAANSAAPSARSAANTAGRFASGAARLAAAPSLGARSRAAVTRTATVAALFATLSSSVPSAALAASRSAAAHPGPGAGRVAAAPAPEASARRLPPVADMVAGAVARVQPVRAAGADLGSSAVILASAAADYCAAGGPGRRHQKALGAHELEMRDYVRDHNAHVRAGRSSAVKGALMVGAAALGAGLAGKAIGHRMGASRGGSSRNFTPVAIGAAVAPGLYRMAKAGDFGRSGFRPSHIIERADRPLVQAPDCDKPAPGASPGRSAAVDKPAPGRAAVAAPAAAPGIGGQVAGALRRGWTSLRSAVSAPRPAAAPRAAVARADGAAASMAARLVAQGPVTARPAQAAGVPARAAQAAPAARAQARPAPAQAAPVRPTITSSRSGARPRVPGRDQAAAARQVGGRSAPAASPAGR